MRARRRKDALQLEMRSLVPGTAALGPPAATGAPAGWPVLPLAAVGSAGGARLSVALARRSAGGRGGPNRSLYAGDCGGAGPLRSSETDLSMRSEDDTDSVWALSDGALAADEAVLSSSEDDDLADDPAGVSEYTNTEAGGGAPVGPASWHSSAAHALARRATAASLNMPPLLCPAAAVATPWPSPDASAPHATSDAAREQLSLPQRLQRSWQHRRRAPPAVGALFLEFQCYGVPKADRPVQGSPAQGTGAPPAGAAACGAAGEAGLVGGRAGACGGGCGSVGGVAAGREVGGARCDDAPAHAGWDAGSKSSAHRAALHTPPRPARAGSIPQPVPAAPLGPTRPAPHAAPGLLSIHASTTPPPRPAALPRDRPSACTAPRAALLLASGPQPPARRSPTTSARAVAAVDLRSTAGAPMVGLAAATRMPMLPFATDDSRAGGLARLTGHRAVRPLNLGARPHVTYEITVLGPAVGPAPTGMPCSGAPPAHGVARPAAGHAPPGRPPLVSCDAAPTATEDTAAPIPAGGPAGWIVERRFSQFEQLLRELRAQMPAVVAASAGQLPSKFRLPSPLDEEGGARLGPLQELLSQLLSVDAIRRSEPLMLFVGAHTHQARRHAWEAAVGGSTRRQMRDEPGGV
mmetsp:Transcript_28312/g.90253  ORF Transcript_28312/g.90253 Transcript_28312/m.90253 type:complete len:636 (+) Transcript_28312:2132-4039(+)